MLFHNILTFYYQSNRPVLKTDDFIFVFISQLGLSSFDLALAPFLLCLAFGPMRLCDEHTTSHNSGL